VGPFGVERADYNTALIVQSIHELLNAFIAVNCGKMSEQPKLEDCLLRFKRLVMDSTLEDQADQEVKRVKAFLAKWKKW
jgi:hypothetical protein